MNWWMKPGVDILIPELGVVKEGECEGCESECEGCESEDCEG